MSDTSRRPQLRLTLPPPPEEVAPGAPEEPPFFRPKNRTRVKRARRGWAARLALYVQLGAFGLIVTSALVAGYSRVMASDRLKVASVYVKGQRFLSEGEVRELLGPAVGENILKLDLKALQARLMTSPWVAEASVKRTLPDTLHVEIVERVPLALAEVERLYLMDGDGALIDIYGPRTASFDLPIVRGLGVTDGEARRGRAERAGALLRDLGELGAFISEVEVEDTGELRVVMRGAGEILRLGPPPYRRKLTTFLALRKDLAQRCPDAEYFDLRYRDRIYVKEPLQPRLEAAERASPSPAPSAAPGDPPAPASPSSDRVSSTLTGRQARG
jgi:cell division septal protein FtsQ